MPVPRRVVIREVGPREGFQTHPTPVATESKVELIHRLGKTGVKEIEVTSFVRPDRVPQMADAVDVVKAIKREEGVVYHGLYLNPKGFEIAEGTEKLDNRCWIYTAASDRFLKNNSNSSHDALLSGLPDWLELFRRYNKRPHGLMVSMAFGNSTEGKFASKELLSLVERYLRTMQELGEEFQEISLADTVGYGDPEAVRSGVATLKEAYPQLEISLHLHDTTGTGLANAYAGLLEGVSCFEASVGGMGGCPFAPGASGNIATEDLVFMLHQMGIETGIDLELYCEVASYAESIIGEPLSGRFYRST